MSHQVMTPANEFPRAEAIIRQSERTDSDVKTEEQIMVVIFNRISQLSNRKVEVSRHYIAIN